MQGTDGQEEGPERGKEEGRGGRTTRTLLLGPTPSVCPLPEAEKPRSWAPSQACWSDLVAPRPLRSLGFRMHGEDQQQDTAVGDSS